MTAEGSMGMKLHVTASGSFDAETRSHRGKRGEDKGKSKPEGTELNPETLWGFAVERHV
jgi:hypothetical protein